MHNLSSIYIFEQNVRKIFGGFAILRAVSHFQSYKKMPYSGQNDYKRLILLH